VTVAKTGISLAETVIALFLLSGAVLTTARLFHVAAQTERRSRVLEQAISMGETVSARVRSWARLDANFRSDWSTWSAPITDPDFPGLSAQVSATASGRTLASPSSRLESPYLTRARLLPGVVVPFRVEVRWGVGVSDRVSLLSYCGAPARPLPSTPSIEIQGLPGSPLSPGQVVPLHARVLDANNQEICGLTFQWSLLPLGGNGQLREDLESRDFRQISIQHGSYLPTGQSAVLPGQLGVLAQARYRGQVLRSSPVNSVPPQQLELAP